MLFGHRYGDARQIGMNSQLIAQDEMSRRWKWVLFKLLIDETLLQLRLLNTNVDGKQKVMYALTKIKGVGRRYSNLVCKKADVDLNKRYARSLDPRPIPYSHV